MPLGLWLREKSTLLVDFHLTLAYRRFRLLVWILCKISGETPREVIPLVIYALARFYKAPLAASFAVSLDYRGSRTRFLMLVSFVWAFWGSCRSLLYFVW
jgi:hypothetical protein